MRLGQGLPSVVLEAERLKIGRIEIGTALGAIVDVICGDG
jgi:hypothetical protein